MGQETIALGLEFSILMHFSGFSGHHLNRHFWEQGVSPPWVSDWRGWCVCAVVSSNGLSLAELPLVTSLVSSVYSGFLNNGDSLVWEGAKSGLGHYLRCGKQMWCCHTLLPGVQGKTQTSQAFLLFCLNPGNSAGIFLIPAG